MSASVELIAVIRSEREGIQALVEVLTDERTALSQNQPDRVVDLGPRKRELLLHIAHLGEHRNRLLERHGLSADRRGMEAWLQSHDAAGTERSEWRALLEATRKAHDLNQGNGVFIEAGMRVNQQALQALMCAGAANGTYGPAGRTTNYLGSRTLASA